MDKEDKESQCLGSREIELRGEITTVPELARVDCYEVPADATQNNGTVNSLVSGKVQPALLIGYRVGLKLELHISDGTSDHYYQGTIDPCDTKILYPDSECNTRVQTLAHHVFHDIPGVALAFDRMASNDSIKVTIRQRLENGIVKLIWSGSLPRRITAPSSQTIPSSCFVLLQLLAATIRREQERNRYLQEKCNSIQSKLDGWKDTAEKLSTQTWQAEKDSLLQNFLILYQKTHNKLCETQLELQHLEDRHRASAVGVDGRQQQQPHTKITAEMKITHHRRTTAAAAARSAGINDFDELIYDSKTIDRLAAGPQSGDTANSLLPKKKIIVFPNDNEVEKATAKAIISKPVARSRTNMHTSRAPPTQNNIHDSPLKTAMCSPQSNMDGHEIGFVKNISSAKELFQELAVMTKRQRTSSPPEKKSQEAKDAESLVKPIEKKTKVSKAVSEKRRKELEKMAAMLSDGDSD